jgi:hypothetical protein
MASKKSNSSGPGSFIALVTAMIAGTTKDIVGKATVTVVKVPMTAAQINAQLGQATTLYGAVVAARAALKVALAAWVAAEPGLRLFVKNYTLSLKALFGSGNPELEDFGLVVKAKAQPSAETKAVAVGLARETRAARGPTGKARAAITTQGKPGLVLVNPSGQPIPGPLAGPIPPGSGTPAAVNLVPGSDGSSPAVTPTPAGSTAAPSTPSTGGPSGSGTPSNG